MSESFVGFRYSLIDVNKRGLFNSAGYLHSDVGYVIKYLLQLPAAGIRNNNNGSLNNVGTNGYYWSSTISGTSAYDLYFNSDDYNTNNPNRANGLSVRCVSELNVNLFLYYGMIK